MVGVGIGAKLVRLVGGVVVLASRRPMAKPIRSMCRLDCCPSLYVGMSLVSVGD